MTERVINFFGLPFHSVGVADNVHSHGLRMRLWNGSGPYKNAGRKKPDAEKTSYNIGLVGEFGFDGGVLTDLCNSFPNQHRLNIFATRFIDSEFHIENDSISIFRMPFCTSILTEVPKRISEKAVYCNAVPEMARRINKADIDILLLKNFSHEELNDLVMLVDSPCIISELMGSRPAFSPKVDYSIYGQNHVSFPVIGREMHSVFTERRLPSEKLCLTVSPLYSDLDIDANDNISWNEREPWIIFHGNIAQLQSESYLSVIGDILEADKDVRFIILGFGDGLDFVLDTFRKRGLFRQVEYLGAVDKSLKLTGEFHERIFQFLRRGRLEPDPWPRGGGAARVEAYWSGTPTVHLRQPFGYGDIVSPDRMKTDIPTLEVAPAVADNLEEYKNLCIKCLYDKEFAEKVITEQYALAQRLTNAEAWWESVIDSYRQWLTGTGWAEGEGPAGGRLSR